MIIVKSSKIRLQCGFTIGLLSALQLHLISFQLNLEKSTANPH